MWVKFLIIFLILFSTEKLSAELYLIYPTPNDSLECGTIVNIKWKNSSSKAINLYYSLDSLNWTLIKDNLIVDNYDWTVPNTIKSKVYFKLFRAGNSGVELIWDMKDAHTNWVQVSKFIDDNRLVTVGRDNVVSVWDIPSRSKVNTTTMGGSQATNFAIGYDKDMILIAQDMVISTWDISLGNTKRIYVNPQLETARVIDYDPNNREVAVGSKKGFVKIIDLFGEEMAHFNISGMQTIYSLDYSADGRFLAVAGDDGFVYIINLETEEIRQSKYHHGDTQNLTIWSVEISNDLKYVISGGVDDKAILWDFNTLDSIKSFEKTSDIRSTKFSKNSNYFLIAGLNKTVDQYFTGTLNNDGATAFHGEQVLWAEYLNNGDTLVSAGRDNSFKVWRNSNSADEIEISTSNLYQEMEINFPELYVNLNDTFEIPIEFKGNFDLLDSIIINYFLPVDIAHILDGLNPIKVITRDEEYSKKFEKGDIQTQVINIATALMSDRRKGDISFADVKFYPEGNYRVNTDDGFIEIIDTCDIDTSRFVIIEKEATDVKINGIVEDNILNYELNTIIDGDFQISIIDLNGNEIIQLQNSYFKNGIYNFSENISSLTKGVYFLITKYENKLISNKFIKIDQ